MKKKVSLGEIVGNLLLILPKHIYVSNLVCSAIVIIFLSLFIFQPKSFIGTWSQVGDHAPLTGQWSKLTLTGNAFRVPTTQFRCVC